MPRLHALILRKLCEEVIPSSCLSELRTAAQRGSEMDSASHSQGRVEGGSDLDVLFLEMRPQRLAVLPFERLSSTDSGRKAPVTASFLNVTQK